MKPIKTEASNFVYTLPGGTGENDLPCRRENGRVISTWQLEPGDLENLSLSTPSIVLGIVWDTEIGHSVTVDDVVDPPDDYEHLQITTGGEIHQQYRYALSAHEARLLWGGALVEVMIAAVPPPPIYVALN